MAKCRRDGVETWPSPCHPRALEVDEARTYPIPMWERSYNFHKWAMYHVSFLKWRHSLQRKWDVKIRWVPGAFHSSILPTSRAGNPDRCQESPESARSPKTRSECWEALLVQMRAAEASMCLFLNLAELLESPLLLYGRNYVCSRCMWVHCLHTSYSISRAVLACYMAEDFGTLPRFWHWVGQSATS